MAKVKKTQQGVRYILLSDYTIVKETLDEVADYIALNPTAINWITVPIQTILEIE